MPYRKGKNISATDMGFIVARVRRLRRDGKTTTQACEITGEEFGRDATTIYELMRRLEPSVEIAQDYLRSQSLRMAMRVVREGNVPEVIDVLGRKNIGVLAPKSEQQGGGGGFFLSVQADSCGAVKVQAAQVSAPALEASTECNDYSQGGFDNAPTQTLPTIDLQPVAEETTHEPKPHTRWTITDRQRRAIEVNRERLNQLRAAPILEWTRRKKLGLSGGSEDGAGGPERGCGGAEEIEGLQEADGEPQDS